MKDVFDMVTDIRSLVNVEAVTSLIDGKVYPNFRPDGSIKADVVVNGLGGLTSDQTQIGSGSINAFVPSIISDGKPVSDQARLSALGKAIYAQIDTKYKTTFRVFPNGQPEIIRDTDGSHFLRVPYKYYSLQDRQIEV